MSTYIIPAIFPLPAGIDCYIRPPLGGIARRLVGGSGCVLWRNEVYHGGTVQLEEERMLRFEDGQLVEGAPGPLRWPGTERDVGPDHGYIEMSTVAADDTTRFRVKDAFAMYGVYNSPSGKSFRSDGDMKYASPIVVAQLARYGQIVDGYPAINFDADRDFGESLAFLNPYGKAILVRLKTHDGREMPRIRVEPQSGRTVSLSPLLQEGTRRWRGRLQATATNRVICYHVRHSLADPTLITDHEHFDGFRSDPSHLPATLILRRKLGAALSVLRR